MESKVPQPESFWSRRSGWLAISIGLAGFTLGILQDIFMVKEGFSSWVLIVLSNMLTGSIWGLFFYQYARNERNRRELVRQRMHTVAELNHHIRNALQVIKFWGVQHQNCRLDDAQIQLMKDSVDRIEWALREVLPRYPESVDTQHPASSIETRAAEAGAASTGFYSAKVIDDQNPE